MNTSKNLSLWQLTSEHQKLLSELYDNETGEFNEIAEAKLNLLETDIEKKCIAVGGYIRKIESEQRELESLLMEVENRIKYYDNERQKYRNYLQSNMEKQGITEIKCPYFNVRIKKNPYFTDIINEELIPDEFMREREIVRVEVKPDKNAIKEEVLSTGEQVPGAYVSQKNKLEITTSKI
jgi:hypothetical protein